MIPCRLIPALLAGLIAAGVPSVFAAEPLPPGDVQPLPLAEEQQQIEMLNPGVGQSLSQAEPGQAEQDIGVPEPKTRAQRTASAVGKVALGVLAAAVAIAAGAASLLLL